MLKEFRERLEYKAAKIRVTSSEKIEEVNNIRGGRDSNENRERKPWCWLHPDRSDHPIWRCEDFQQKSPEERLSLVKKNKACYGCLVTGHSSGNCRRNFTCKENDCGQPHHRLLHEAYTVGLTFHSSSNKGNAILLMQRIRAYKGQGKVVQMNVLWDNGSTISFVTFKWAEMMKLKGRQEKIQLLKF